MSANPPPRSMRREERQQLLEFAKAKRRAREATGASTSPGRRLHPMVHSLQANEEATAKLEQELAVKSDEVARWRLAASSLREEQRHLGLEVGRLGKENEQLHKEITRRNQDTDALRVETALKEREMHRADTYAKQAAERLEQVYRTEQRLATAEAALVHCRKEAADSKMAADAAAEQLALANSVSRGDEAIAAAEVLVLRDELDSVRHKQAETAKALGERSEECDTWMTSYKQLEVEHAVLQERVGELEEARAAAETRAAESIANTGVGGERTARMSTTSSADMYDRLANSSDWSARQMGAIEGCLSQLGVPELAELFSFVWVTAATASTSPSPDTVSAVEQAVVSAQRHVRAAVKKRDSMQTTARRRSSRSVSAIDAGEQHDSVVKDATVRAVGRVLREAAKVLHRGVCDISSSSSTGAIPAPVPAVDLWRGDIAAAKKAEQEAELDDSLLDECGIPTAVKMLSSEIQTALLSLASTVTRLREARSHANLAPTRDNQEAAAAAAELDTLRQEVHNARQQAINAEASYAAERDGHTAAMQELNLLQNHVRSLQEEAQEAQKTRSELRDLQTVVNRLYSSTAALHHDASTTTGPDHVSLLAAVEDRVSHLERALAEREGDVATLVAANEKQVVETAKLTALLRTIDTELKAVSEQLAVATKEKSELAASLDAAQRKGTEASNALAVAEQSLATLSAKLTEAESALVVKTESLTKASERNKEVTFMLAWLERQYDQMDQGYESVKTEAWKAKEALGRERTVNAQARADLAMLKARRK